MIGYGERAYGGKWRGMVSEELYKEGTCRVRFGEIETDWFEVEEGLKQGCSLSLVLFALYLAELGERLVNNNNNNNHLYFTRVTQSNTRFDFRCGPQI